MLKTSHVQLRGRFVKDDLFSLTTLSLHRGVINLLDKDCNRIVSLIEERKNMTALSLLVPGLFSAIKSTNNHIHLKQSTRPFCIEFNGHTVDYSHAPLWEETLPLNPLCENDRLKELNFLSQEIDPGESLFCIFQERCRNIFQIKARSLLNETISVENGFITGLENLIGLGQGLTPSGDDFITGALLGEICSGSSLKINRTKLTQLMERTTYAGQTLLHLALKGSFPAYLLSFLEEIERSQEIHDQLKSFLKAAQHGSTSGLDSLAGFYWYFKFTNAQIHYK